MIHTVRSAAFACALLGMWGAAVAVGLARACDDSTRRQRRGADEDDEYAAALYPFW